VTRLHAIEPVLVEQIPRALEPGKLYISAAYDTVTHLCACGCGSEVVTPLHPARWRLTWDGKTASLSPSVGSWALACRSHYVIKKNRVVWGAEWSEEKVARGRARDRRALESYFADDAAPIPALPAPDAAEGGSRLQRIWRRLCGRPS
jgi:hypothetical protein